MSTLRVIAREKLDNGRVLMVLEESWRAWYFPFWRRRARVVAYRAPITHRGDIWHNESGREFESTFRDQCQILLDMYDQLEKRDLRLLTMGES